MLIGVQMPIKILPEIFASLNRLLTYWTWDADVGLRMMTTVT
jgi:hypothetical protein